MTWQTKISIILFKTKENLRESYEKLLGIQKTKKWRKMKQKEKEKFIPVLDEPRSFKGTEVLILPESLDSDGSENIRCNKPICKNKNI